jgi:hypothetical protein
MMNPQSQRRVVIAIALLLGLALVLGSLVPLALS